MPKSRKPEQAVEPEAFCSFCGKSMVYTKMVAGPNVNICSDCVKACNQILAEEEQKILAEFLEDVPKPKAIKEYLDNYVIGQDYAKRVLSVAVYNPLQENPAQAESRFGR